MSRKTHRNPWAWIPTLYFAQGLPYVAVNVITVIMFKRLGISNTDIALYTGWLYLPWVIKPFWSPFVDIIRTKRWWTLTMQWIVGFGFAAVAFAIPTPFFFQLTLAIFWVIGFASATHDIASDGYYMIALDEHDQAAYVGIRSTFYRIAMVVGQGVLVIIAGVIESNTGLDPANFEITANPQQEFVANAKYHEIAEVNVTEAQAATQQFVYTENALEMATVVPDMVPVTVDSVVTNVPYTEYASSLKAAVLDRNVANGFAVKNSEQTIKEKKTGEKSQFESWIKNTFGEKERQVKSVGTNFAIIGVRLSQKPADDEEFIYVASLDKGNQSIKLTESDEFPTRFVFNSQNWDKVAYMVVTAEPNIPDKSIAEFKGTSGNIPLAWSIVFGVLSIFFLCAAMYHSYILPTPSADRSITGDTKPSAREIFRTFGDTFVTFFKKKQIWIAMAFMLLYRLPEAQLVKIINPFFLDPTDKGGLGLTTGQVGIVYGTIGIIALTLGGIIGGICASRGGLKKWLWPMALCISLNSLVYIYLSAVQPPASSMWGMTQICIGMFLDQFGYGFGFTAFMLYMMYFADGPLKTSHYAICTAFMALGMMLPGMWSGWLQELIGYNHFFCWTLLCCFATWIVTALIKVDPNYGLKDKTPHAENEESASV